MPQPIVLLSIPQLRERDLSPGTLPSLELLVRRGEVAEYLPPFPSLAASVFASLTTGAGPGLHGMIGDAYFDRGLGVARARPFLDSEVLAPKMWERLRAYRPDSKTLAWFTPSLRGASVDIAAWVDSDNVLRTRPEGLADSLQSAFGSYPAPRVDPKGEPLRLESARWILRSAARQIADARPDLALVRLAFLGQVARRYGPDGQEAGRALWNLEPALREFLAVLPRDSLVIVFTESVSTPVSDPIYPNLVLRGKGLIELASLDSGGTDIDTANSPALALADHQLCHIYLNDPSVAASIASEFAGPSNDGIGVVATGARRSRLGLGHPRAGDLILMARPDRYFAPDWWTVTMERPSRLPAPSGLARHAALSPQQVQGSLGALPPNSDYHGVVLCSRRGVLPQSSPLTVFELYRAIMESLGLPVEGP